MTRFAILALRLLARLPLSIALPFGRRLGRWLLPIAGYRRRVAEVNLKLCFPALSDDQRTELLKRNFEALGLSIVEMALAWCAPREKIAALAHFEGLEHLQAAQSAGRGVILLSFHFTHLEMGARLIAEAAPVHPMYRRNRNPLIDDFIRQARARHMAEPIEREAMRDLVRTLKRGGTVWYAPDQSYNLRHSVFVPFFGVSTSTITTTSRLARSGNALVIPYLPIRRPDGRFRLRLLPPLEGFPCGDDTEDSARINALLESVVREHPEQYLWIHRRFKSRPEGEPPVYSRKKR